MENHYSAALDMVPVGSIHTNVAAHTLMKSNSAIALKFPRQHASLVLADQF